MQRSRDALSGDRAGQEDDRRRLLYPQDLRRTVVVPKAVVFKSEDGLDIHGQCLPPRQKSARSSADLYARWPMRAMLLGFSYNVTTTTIAYAMKSVLGRPGLCRTVSELPAWICMDAAFREAATPVGAGRIRLQRCACWREIPKVYPPWIEENRLWADYMVDNLTRWDGPQLESFASGSGLHGVHDWSVFLPRWENRPGAPDSKERRSGV